jgi:DNA-binding MarR family transcriptional regulator
MGTTKLTDDAYAAIFEFRIGLRRFLEWSRQRAVEAGITATQHQLLLAIRGTNDPLGLTITEIAELLALRHHSTVELIDRAVDKGIVARYEDAEDRRIVRVRLTAKGAKALETITLSNFEQLVGLAPRMTRLLDRAGA